MSKRRRSRNFIGSLLFVFLLLNPLLAFAKPKAKPKPKPNPVSETPLQKAQRELPKNYFVVYAIVDKIARANGLDNKPWRIVVTSNYNVNAYASDTNLLTFEAGLMDQLEGNASALACAIAHEMGHHTRQHLGYGPAKQEQAKREEIEKAEKAKIVEQQDAQTQALIGAGVATGMAAAGQQVGGIGGGLLQLGGLLFGGASQQKAQNIEAIKAKIELEAETNYNKRLMEISQTQEFEADENGYIYSVTAGFDPNGCIAVMDILGRMPGAQSEGSSHPSPEKRTQQINALMVKNPPETLKAKGKIFLSTKPTPLKYEIFSYEREGGGTSSGLKVFPITGSTQEDLNRYLN